MKSTSTAFATIANGASARYYSKYTVDGKNRTDTLNNFKLTNISNADNDISIGNTCASSVSFSIYMPSVSLENKEITIYEGLDISGTIQYVKLGIFRITKQEDDGEYTSYEGYDRMYSKMEMGYFSKLTFPNTDKAILDEVCSQVGITLATAITTTHTITEKPSGYTRREMIGYMAALQGKNGVINADGNLELRWYADYDYKLDGNKYYEGGVTFTTSKNFVLQTLTCYTGAVDDNNNSISYTSGSGATGITFNNPFMTQAILDEVYKKVGGFTYRPLSVQFVGDFRLDVGDIITVTKNGTDYIVPIMKITHECDGGLISTIQSIGKSDSENSTVQSGALTKQMQRYYADLLIVNKALINKLDVETAKITYATIDNLKATDAEIEKIKTNQITTDYLNAHYADIDFANINKAVIKAAMIDFASIKDANITTAYITDANIVGLSANKVTAGKVDAAVVEIINLNCANLTVGTINGTQIAPGAIDWSNLSTSLGQKITDTADDVDQALKDAGLAQDSIDNLQIGGANVLLNSKTLLNSKYFLVSYWLTDESSNPLINEKGELLCA